MNKSFFMSLLLAGITITASEQAPKKTLQRAISVPSGSAIARMTEQEFNKLSSTMAELTPEHRLAILGATLDAKNRARRHSTKS